MPVVSANLRARFQQPGNNVIHVQAWSPPLFPGFLVVQIKMMNSSQIRQSFLDFFKSKSHTIVPSSSLLPDSPNLLFTNAGMNQFVPIFLGQVKCPYTPGRAADTQKCIRAGGKHNDLDDVGLDTYHHTFFEMLGNWSFGDYFKREAIDWAWELVVKIWKFPPQRLYATVYSPDKTKNDPSEFDQEAWDFWAEKFRSAGLDPAAHIVNGNKKDNFWMMGDTGPCGPCSELHVDLTQQGDTGGALVNKGSSECIEIWNLVFIQFNANTDGTFSPLPAKHVDTGMGFERVASIIQCTKNFTNFGTPISNYETDIFRPIFDELEKLSGKKYDSTLPAAAPAKVEDDAPLKTSGEARGNIIEVEAEERGVHSSSPCDDEDNFPVVATNAEQIQLDIAFRVIADHIRTLSFAIADGIQPGNTDRNYVLRRILRRAVRYGRTLGFHEPFFYKLVDVLAHTMGDIFPEIRARKKQVQETIRTEEEAFNKTLDKGLEIFDAYLFRTLADAVKVSSKKDSLSILYKTATSEARSNSDATEIVNIASDIPAEFKRYGIKLPLFQAKFAFDLYDTYGFPFDLTELMARERGLTVDKAGFDVLMEEQRARARAAQKKEVISLSQIETTTPTQFIGFENLKTTAHVLEVARLKDRTAVILDTSVCYAEMGGQVGDTGMLFVGDENWKIFNTQRSSNTWLHILETEDEKKSRLKELAELLELKSKPRLNAPEPMEILTVGSDARLSVNQTRRRAIERHHTVTHLLHWALHELASEEASQKGSFVGPDKLTFDFNSAPLTLAQIADIEKLVNERIVENAPVTWMEVKHNHVKDRKDVMQFFGDKYGEWVRVVQIGGKPTALDGYSMELCGGTHVRATGEIGLFRIIGESAIAAGVRRIEAVAGLTAYDVMKFDRELIKTVAGKVNSPIHELEKKIENLLAHQKELEKEIKIAMQRNASNAASELLGQAQTVNGIPLITHNLGNAEGDFLQAIADALKGRFKGVVVLGGGSENAVTLIATVSSDFTAKVQAGKIIQAIAPIVGGKGGGKPDNARGGGKDVSKLDEALAKAKTLLV
jgi:alanyl-tRNA synthetase